MAFRNNRKAIVTISTRNRVSVNLPDQPDMIDQLNNPVWAALNSDNQNLGFGNDNARYFKPEISPFASVAVYDEDHFRELFKIIPVDQPVAIFVADQKLNAAPWNIVNRISGYQMMYEGLTPASGTNEQIHKLTEKDVPDMMKLTQLSPPGPFLEGTIQFGGYEGIFDNGQLVAMAGHRFHSGPYVEISAVCTHPDHTGKGYARELINSQILQLRTSGHIPYLHVRADNARACAIYQKMGFVIRTEMIIYILTR